MEQTGHSPYEDMFDLPHHQSATHAHMSMIGRAAQFSPFAALTGYDDCIKETARTTERRIELDDGEKLRINDRLRLLQDKLFALPHGEIPDTAITYFIPDKTKTGGRYETVTGAVKKIDDYAQLVVMSPELRIPMADIYTLSGPLFEEMEDGEMQDAAGRE